ncbi:uncharacterized protein O3C94_010921 [Discoglossus pictus]
MLISGTTKSSTPNGKKDSPGKNGSNQGHYFLEEEEALIQQLEKNPEDLSAVSIYVKRNEGKFLELTGSPGLFLRVCDLNGTIYMGQTYMLNSWQSLYLPKKINMEVLGTVDNCSSPAPGLQLVVLVAEDGCVYVYENETLYLLANSLREFAQDGVQHVMQVHEYPSDLSDEEEETLQKDQKIRQRTREFVDNGADEFGHLLGLI